MSKIQGGTATTEDAAEDAPEVVAVVGAEVVDISPSRDAEVDNTTPPIAIVHTIV